jgi:hypothetical protein
MKSDESTEHLQANTLASPVPPFCGAACDNRRDWREADKTPFSHHTWELFWADNLLSNSNKGLQGTSPVAAARVALGLADDFCDGSHNEIHSGCLFCGPQRIQQVNCFSSFLCQLRYLYTPHTPAF